MLIIILVWRPTLHEIAPEYNTRNDRARVTIGSYYNYHYFVTGWITAIFYCQILGLISSLITAIVVILFTCVSQTKGNAAVGNILKVVSAITGI